MYIKNKQTKSPKRNTELLGRLTWSGVDGQQTATTHLSKAFPGCTELCEVWGGVPPYLSQTKLLTPSCTPHFCLRRPLLLRNYCSQAQVPWESPYFTRLEDNGLSQKREAAALSEWSDCFWLQRGPRTQVGNSSITFLGKSCSL